MRFLCLFFALFFSLTIFGQQPTTMSSASDWATLTITPGDSTATLPIGPRSASARTGTSAKRSTASTAKPTGSRVTATNKPANRSFLETFANNRNGWLTGRRNGFELEIANDSYYIRRSASSQNRPARSYIKLPDDLNLNQADTFTVSVEMVTATNVSPDGGLLIGVKDTSNYCQFRVLGTSKVALYTRVNGVAQPGYMAGKPTAAKVAISATRNTLTVRRTGEQLHFYVNGREVEDSPHPFRPFKGNGIGFISFAEALKFQYLTVQLGK